MGSGVDGEFQLAFLAVFHAQAFHEQRGESGTGAASETMEDEETLQACTSLSLKDKINNSWIKRTLTDGQFWTP